MRRQQRLVGGDHMLAVRDRFQHQLFRHTIAADQLDDDVHFGVGHHREGIVGDAACATGDLLRQFQILVRYHGDTYRAPGTACNLFRVAPQHRKSTATDRTDTEESYVDWLHLLLPIC
jgi:hypothetical protein